MRVKHGCGASTIHPGTAAGGFETLVGLAFALPKLAAELAGTAGRRGPVRSGCGCARCRKSDPRDSCCDRGCGCCDSCRCKGEGHGEHCAPPTDVWLEPRLGEVKVARLLVENNHTHPVTIRMEAGPWLDACGRTVPADNVGFDPATASLQPGQAAEVRVVVKAAEPLEAGMAYFGEIRVEGCSAHPISVGLCVAPDTVDHYAVCDPCRKRHGRCVEVCCEPCCCEGSSTCGDGPVCIPDPWSTCGWPGTWDPHHHWLDSCSCRCYYLPARRHAEAA